jgi:hypothetical protein
MEAVRPNSPAVLPASEQASSLLQTVVDIRGRPHAVFGDTVQAVVLLFVLDDCPIANSYAPEIRRLDEEFSARGVSLFVVHAERRLTAEAAARHAEEYGLDCPVLLDPDHRLVRMAQATRTPEAAVFSPQGKLLYRGRIDDAYAAYGKRRPQPTSRDLVAAVHAVLAGRPVPVPRTDVIGCPIPEVVEGPSP